MATSLLAVPAFATVFTIVTIIAQGESDVFCNTDGYAIHATSDAACAISTISCSAGNERWDIPGCGCGCKRECVALGDSFLGPPAMCNGIAALSSTALSCPSGYEIWEDPDCGCGCTLSVADADIVIGNEQIAYDAGKEAKYDTGPYFGFINFDGNQYAIYEFILVVFILMAFVLNVTFVGYACVVRFKDLDYSFVRDIRRNEGNVLYEKTATEDSDDTSLEFS